MTIHDDAEAARRKVYDDALAALQSQLAAAQASLSTAAAQLTARTGERDAATAQVTALQGQVDQLQAQLAELEQPAPVDDPMLPTSIMAEAEVRALFGIPSTVPVTIVAASDTRHPFAIRKATPKGVLAFPQREWAFDTSQGFAASGVTAVDGPNGKTPVVSTLPLWFEMLRIGDGIVGMGPGTRFTLGGSSFTAPAQPLPQKAYFTSGGTQELSGVQNAVIGAWGSETSTGTVWFGNFTATGRDLGGCAYNLFRLSGGRAVIRRIAVDGGWRGFKGEPNGEAGALTFGGGAAYDIDGALLTSVGGPSPLMFNSAPSGTIRNARTTRPNYGMPTWWRCTGVHQLVNVEINGGQVGLNNEQPVAGMSLDFVSGQVNLPSKADGGLYHYTGSSPNGSTKVHFGKDFHATGGAVDGKICVNQYAAYDSARKVIPPKQRKADITSDGQELVYFGSWAD